jgi:hypothetical protein
MAAEQDMPVALFELGMLCIQGYQRDGWDIPQDTHLGRHFLEKFLKLYQHTSGFALFSKKAQKVLNELPKDSIKTIKIKGRKREHNAFM